MKGGLNGIAITIAFFFTLAFVTNFQAYVHSLRIGIFPYHWFVAASVLFLLLAFFSGSLWKLPRENTYLILWFLILNFSMLLSLLFVSSIPASQQVYVGVSLFSAIAVTYTMLLRQPQIIKACGIAVAIGVCILVIVSYIEFFNPDFNIIDDVMFGSKGTVGKTQRVGGLYENPNANGYAMALGMFVGQFFLPRSIRFIFALLVGLAVLATVSRSALILWTLILLTSFWMGAYSKGRVLPKLFSIFFVAIAAGLLITGQVPHLIEVVGLDHLVNQNMIDRLSGGFLTQDDSSTLQRKSLISENLQKFSENPVFGLGLGSSGSAEFEVDLGSHNMALRMAVEMGIIGLLVYLSLLAVPLIAGSFYGVVFILMYFVANFFTHTSFEQPVFAVLIPLSILAFSELSPSNASRKKRRRRRKKSHRTTQSDSPSSPVIG